MSMIRRDRPALTTLHAFVIAARHESIRRAADELGITASAVSHQIRKLEDWIGAAVFLRAPRQIRLTPLGKRLYRRMSGGFESIETAIVGARESTVDTVLRVSALPLFTSAWLIPRLERFDALCAKAGLEISIEIDTTNALADFGTGRVDVGIRNLMQPDAKLVSRKLVDLSAIPLCTPRVARGLTGPEDLQGVTLIHISGRARGWERWLKASGAKPVEPRANLSFDTIPAALDAALAGRGVMLGLDPLIWDVPAVTRLVIPFEVKRVSAGSYYVVYRRSDRMRRAVKMFADWLVDEMRADSRRLATMSRAARASVRQHD
jgi:LysR family glycine cleavage system transcriptional activator